MKRFTETAKWSDPWFCGLPAELKLAWLYLLDNCDAAGVIDLNRPLADFQIGHSVAWESFLESAGDRVAIISKGKIWLTGFISFQYGRLSEDCKAHRPVFASLERHSLSKGYPEGFQPLKDKEKDKDKEKEKDTEGGVGETKPARRFVKPTLVAVADYFHERGGADDSEAFFDFYESKGWRVGDQPMKDWKASVRNWQRGGNRGSPRNGQAAAVVSYADMREPEP